MKILNVCHIIAQNGGGGTAERTIQMSHYLANEGVDCTILTLNFNIEQPLREYLGNVQIIALNYFSNRFFIPFPNFIQMYNAVKNADYVHLMNHWTILNVYIFIFCKLLSKKYVVCPAGSLTIFGRSKVFKKIYNFFVGINIIKLANRCIAVTSEEVIQLIEHGAKKEKIEIIPNGIACTELKKDLDFPSRFFKIKTKYILFLGRLNTIKGPDLLLEAFIKIHGQLNDLSLIFAGPDEGLLNNLQALTKHHNLEHKIQFVGFLSGENKKQAIANAECLVIPSRHEAMSIVVLEAGVLGTPSIITDQCGFDIIESSQCGKVVPATAEALQFGLIDFFSDQNKINLYSKNIYEFTLNNYDWKKIIQSYIKIYST